MGETILGNRYEIIRKIGDGGMAFVYEARDKLLNRIVAVKVLRPEFVDDEEFLAKFKREAEAVANITHPNIVNVYDVGADGKVHYIVMEYVDGQNLKEIIKDEGTLDEYTALDITKQIARALGAAHKKGVVHRDIKPHNILISKEGRQVKVADFGIAKAATNSTMTNIGSIIGSVHYFSPEQAKGKSVRNNADLYSLGIVLYEMILGKVPFKGDSPISIALQHINEDIEFTSEEKTNVPQSIRTLIKKLTEKSPDERYQSTEEVIEDIEYIEQNIDLDFIKQYDDFATKKINPVGIVNQSTDRLEHVVDEDDEEDDDYDDKKYKKRKKKGKGIKILIISISLLLVGALGILGANAFGLFGNQQKEEDGVISAPYLINMSLENANKIITDLDLRMSVVPQYSDTVEKDYVISQSPNEYSPLKRGDTITIVISKGPEALTVPNLIGSLESQAKGILESKGLVLGRIDYRYNAASKGTIIDQSVSANSNDVKKGEVIDIVVSRGPEATPEPTPPPNPEPDPNPEPTPDPNPEPTPDPNPEPTPDPNPEPTPPPNPEPTPPPNPDSGGTQNTGQSTNNE